MWIPPVSFVSCRTPIPMLTCCSVRSAASNPSTRPDLMLSEAILIARPISFPFYPLTTWPQGLVSNQSYAFSLRDWATPCQSGQTTHQRCPFQFSPSCSLVIGSLPYVHSNLWFTALWCSSPPSVSWPGMLAPLAPPPCVSSTEPPWDLSVPPPNGHLTALRSGRLGQGLVHNLRV